jgi:hypothetical protein
MLSCLLALYLDETGPSGNSQMTLHVIGLISYCCASITVCFGGKETKERHRQRKEKLENKGPDRTDIRKEWEINTRERKKEIKKRKGAKDDDMNEINFPFI